jgi:hypothetical protein
MSGHRSRLSIALDGTLAMTLLNLVMMDDRPTNTMYEHFHHRSCSLISFQRHIPAAVVRRHDVQNQMLPAMVLNPPAGHARPPHDRPTAAATCNGVEPPRGTCTSAP